jgi:hypothetical protein
MAEKVLFISWGENVAGREERGLEVFNETVGMYGRMQADGRIESFDVVLLEPNAGYLEVRGSAEQLAVLRESDEFLRSMTDASLIVHDMKVAEGYTGTAIPRILEIYQQAITKVPQTA